MKNKNLKETFQIGGFVALFEETILVLVRNLNIPYVTMAKLVRMLITREKFYERKGMGTIIFL